MGLQETKLESLPFVTAELNYLAPTPGKPRTYAFDPPPGEPKSTALPEPHNVPIFDARLIAGNFSLDREGFALVRHPDHRQEFLRRQGSEKRLLSRRRGLPAGDAEGRPRRHLRPHRAQARRGRRRYPGRRAAPAGDAGPCRPDRHLRANRVREHLPDEADELLKGRVQVINVWRPIRGPVRDAPLAMADGQTVAPDDLVASDLIYPNRSGETYSVKYNPNQRWYYIPEMTDGRGAAAEVLRFRDRRPHAVRAAYGLRRSDHAGRRRPAREHRAADAGVSQELIAATAGFAFPPYW